jgi:hypothetical protein
VEVESGGEIRRTQAECLTRALELIEWLLKNWFALYIKIYRTRSLGRALN